MILMLVSAVLLSSMLFFTDFRKVNDATKPDSFSLAHMEDCIDRVSSASFVTKLDLPKGHWQVPLAPRASEISAFVTPDSAVYCHGFCDAQCTSHIPAPDAESLVRCSEL